MSIYCCCIYRDIWSNIISQINEQKENHYTRQAAEGEKWLKLKTPSQRKKRGKHTQQQNPHILMLITISDAQHSSEAWNLVKRQFGKSARNAILCWGNTESAPSLNWDLRQSLIKQQELWSRWEAQYQISPRASMSRKEKNKDTDDQQ